MTNTNAIEAETINHVCDRLKSAARIEDQRDALNDLKAVSKKCQVEIDTRCVTLLGEILQGDRSDLDLIQLTLEALTNLITYDLGWDEEPSNLQYDNIVQLTEIFINDKKHVDVVLELIKTNDFNVRHAAIRFLTALLTNCTEQMQRIIVGYGPKTFPKLLDLLADEHEVIRNDAILLVQILIYSNWLTQRIFLFESGLDRLFAILVDKRGNEEDVTVEDCLSVLLNLLENNSSSQLWFCTDSFISRLFGFFRFGLIQEPMWSTQKVINARHLLKIIRTLVLPTNSIDNILLSQQQLKEHCKKGRKSNQTVISHILFEGVLRHLCRMVELLTIPTDVLAETINTISDTIRGNTENQFYLSCILRTTDQVQRLYKMAFDQTQSFQLRISILYCLQCYLYKNDLGKSIIIQMLLPEIHHGTDQHSLGHLLIIGYMSKDVVASWCCGIALSHLIADSLEYKETILQVVLQIDQDQTAARSLMEISFDLLQNPSSSFHTRIAVLIFLCTWLSNCSSAVQAFISIENTISYLISQIRIQSVANDRELLIQPLCSFALGLCLVFNNNRIESFSSEILFKLIDQEISIGLFQETLRKMSTSKYYSRVKEQPMMKLTYPCDMDLDYEFTRLYETLESLITSMLHKDEKNSTDRSDI